MRLYIAWEDGPRATLDMAPSIRKGGVFSMLENPENFNKVRIGERGRTIEWPEPADAQGYPIIDIDAESLMAMLTAQKQGELNSKINSIARSIRNAAKAANIKTFSRT
jgi:hypothetical protein